MSSYWKSVTGLKLKQSQEFSGHGLASAVPWLWCRPGKWNLGRTNQTTGRLTDSSIYVRPKKTLNSLISLVWLVYPGLCIYIYTYIYTYIYNIYIYRWSHCYPWFPMSHVFFLSLEGFDLGYFGMFQPANQHLGISDDRGPLCQWDTNGPGAATGGGATRKWQWNQAD